MGEWEFDKVRTRRLLKKLVGKLYDILEILEELPEEKQFEPFYIEMAETVQDWIEELEKRIHRE